MKSLARVFIGVLLTASASAATAQSLYTPRSYSGYDWPSGNSYQVQRNFDSTTVNGFNSRTGSTWRLQQRDSGSYSGTDANGNYFFGNHNTGSYTNLGTGRTCFGKGRVSVLQLR